MLRRAACAALLITAAVTVIQTAPVNLTETWAFKYWTVKIRLQFATGSDALTGTDWPILTAIAQVLKVQPSVKIQIAGHTDATGDAAANQALSERRAEAVKQVLVERHGADGSRISTRGWGAEQAIEENTTEEGKALNRRVEIIASR
jgi:OmpA-OmpF porin, OOP family